MTRSFTVIFSEYPEKWMDVNYGVMEVIARIDGRRNKILNWLFMTWNNDLIVMEWVMNWMFMTWNGDRLWMQMMMQVCKCSFLNGCTMDVHECWLPPFLFGKKQRCKYGFFMASDCSCVFREIGAILVQSRFQRILYDMNWYRFLVGGFPGTWLDYFPRNIENNHPNRLSYFSEGLVNHQPE